MKNKNNISKPNISIVMPMFNSEETILSAVSSVLNQNYESWELIIIDDGSTDNSLNIVKSIDNHRIFVYSQENSGVSIARNVGVSKARSDLIAFLDSDDEWLPDFLVTIMKLVKLFPECSLYATSYFFKYQDKSDLMPIKVPDNIRLESFQKIINYFQITIQGEPIFYTSCVAVHKEKFESIGGFPKNIKGGEDILTWARFALSSDIAYCAKPLAIYNLPAVQSRAVRTLPNEDPVGDEMLKMLNEYKSSEKSSGLIEYIGHWYKIRASTYLSKGYRLDGKKYTSQAITYSGLTPKLLVYYIIACIPSPFSAIFFRFFLKTIQLLRISKIKFKKDVS